MKHEQCPSDLQRRCSSDQKRQPINVMLQHHTLGTSHLMGGGAKCGHKITSDSKHTQFQKRTVESVRCTNFVNWFTVYSKLSRACYFMCTQLKSVHMKMPYKDLVPAKQNFSSYVGTPLQFIPLVYIGWKTTFDHTYSVQYWNILFSSDWPNIDFEVLECKFVAVFLFF